MYRKHLLSSTKTWWILALMNFLGRGFTNKVDTWGVQCGGQTCRPTCGSAVETSVWGVPTLNQQRLPRKHLHHPVAHQGRRLATQRTANFGMEIAAILHPNCQPFVSSDVTDFQKICNVIHFHQLDCWREGFLLLYNSVFLFFIIFIIFLSHSDWITLMLYCQCFFVKKKN